MLKEACLEYVSCPIGEAFITEGINNNQLLLKS